MKGISPAVIGNSASPITNNMPNALLKLVATLLGHWVDALVEAGFTDIWVNLYQFKGTKFVRSLVGRDCVNHI